MSTDPTWKANDRREIDQVSKDYVVEDGGFSTMNAVRQRVYIALSRVVIAEKKKTADISELTKSRINAALQHLIDAGLIDNVTIQVDATQTSTLVWSVIYRNLTLGKLEAVDLS